MFIDGIGLAVERLELMSSRYWIGAIVLISLIGISFAGPIMSKVEEPEYVVEASDSNIEIRNYSSMILAEVEVKGRREDAIREGFRIIADYIFGHNASSKEISMTAPVQQQQVNNNWRVSFVMPSEYSRNSLPKPFKENLFIRELSPTRYVVIKFSGFSTKDNLERHETALSVFVKNNSLKVVGTPKYAFYNPPWTLPFMRRNELMLQLAE